MSRTKYKKYTILTLEFIKSNILSIHFRCSSYQLLRLIFWLFLTFVTSFKIQFAVKVSSDDNCFELIEYFVGFE